MSTRTKSDEVPLVVRVDIYPKATVHIAETRAYISEKILASYFRESMHCLRTIIHFAGFQHMLEQALF